jgi:hypothetical protein
VWLSCFDAGQDAQVGKLLAATRQVGGVALNMVGWVTAGAEMPASSAVSCWLHSVKSTCSVNANPGRPISTARAQASCIDDEVAVSHDHREWTWLSVAIIAVDAGTPRQRAGERSDRLAVDPQPTKIDAVAVVLESDGSV